VPKVANSVEAAHTANENLLFNAIKKAAVDENGLRRSGDGLEWTTFAGLKQICQIARDSTGKPMALRTGRRCLSRLLEKHSVQVIRAEYGSRRRRQRGRKPNGLGIPTYSSILAARRNDPHIGKSMRADGKIDLWIRGKGRRFMTAPALTEWSIPAIRSNTLCRNSSASAKDPETADQQSPSERAPPTGMPYEVQAVILRHAPGIDDNGLNLCWETFCNALAED
jgi:hypothetical protein